ncbi:ATP-dependent DNA helicase PIF1 [Erysiphe neolycopersici]|uniref:ATP-dependent DNA helicase PIF1 n=1 Tax=Erysiphe neolycopersici TaxID=212602 RepID=A0A420HWK8_9PEZI|nr:ATP-dependent DNA helicase PIF1 [Erysiphe neolycopersici]
MSWSRKLSSVLSAASPRLSRFGGKFPRVLCKIATIQFYHYVLWKIFVSKDMLGRAAKEFDYKPAKSERQKISLLSTSLGQNGNIQTQFQSISQSIIHGNGKNSDSVRIIGGETPITQLNNQNKKPMILNSSFRSISTSKNLFSIFNKQDSFQDTYTAASMENKGSITSNFASSFVEFNEDDFDFDDDLDLDIKNDLPKLNPEQIKPIQSSFLSPPRLNVLKASGNRLNVSQDHPSSMMTWSSSSPSHKLPPPLPSPRMKRETEEILFESSSQPVRPPKRRTLPWLQKQAEEDLIKSEREDENKKLAFEPSESYQAKNSFNSNSNSPHTQQYGKNAEYNSQSTPLSNKRGETLMPWNTTGSAIKIEKKKLRDKYTDSKKNDEPTETFERSEWQPKLSVTPISLSEEQNKVLDLVINQSKSVFFTGSAGTGKSVLMRAIISELKKKYFREPDRVAVTASTGLAACNIGGVTLHSFGGIGLGKDDVPALVRKIKRNPKAKMRWLKVKVLIIDEVSMVDGELFDKLEGIARAMRNNGRPFGGIQLVVTGDFFQLPPVPDFDSKHKDIKFAFDAGTWCTSIHHTIGLTQIFRQKDPVFANMLNEMRLGKISEQTVKTFQSLNRNISGDGMEATELFPTRREVENANATRMRNLNGAGHKYVARDSGNMKPEEFREKLLSNMMAPKVLELKKGAQVMLIKNMDDGLVNGTVGKVKSFMSERDFKLLGDTAQGRQELEDSSDDDDNDETKGTLGSNLSSKYQRKEAFSETDSGTMYPYVSFKLSDGTRRMMLILPETWKVELPNGEVQAQRIQVPLILAWALSIHKAQGQTLPRVKIDLRKIFEKGQAYVALSRSTTQAGLQVLNFDKSKVLAHPKVAQFYNNLYNVNNAKK